nr:hypothetical protein [Haloarchaeobius litoreus]
MAPDIEVPEPPDLSNRGMPRDFEWEEETLGSEDFYREDVEDLLQEGAWKEGFNEWTEYTSLDEAQVRLVDDLGLFQAFDFYWDPTEDRLRFDAPTVPDDWRELDATESLSSSTVSMIDGALDDLGRVVQEVLEDYIERNDEASNYGWGDETYGSREE